MNEIIMKRKSIRKFDPTALGESVLDTVREQIRNCKPLYPDIKYSVKIVDKAKGAFGINAPHYLAFSSEEKDGAYENIGFIGQQLDLFLSSSGLGSCWIGMAKPEEKETSSLQHVICIAFGKPAEPLHRDISAFSRLPLTDICEGYDERIEAARLAPSARNMQGWFFVAEDDKIICYRKKPGALLGFIFSKLGAIDMGIALCHISEESEDFSFKKETSAPDRKGYIYAGTVC